LDGENAGVDERGAVQLDLSGRDDFSIGVRSGSRVSCGNPGRDTIDQTQQLRIKGPVVAGPLQ